jgi:tellurite resistance protein TehA-like permease
MLLFVAVIPISTYIMVMQPIQIKLMPSTLLLGLLLAISMLACAIMASLPMALYFKLVIIALILVSSAYFILRDALLMLPWSWQMVDVNSKGELTISNKRGEQFQPALAANSFIHAACTILNFKRVGFKIALIPVTLFSSAESENELRRLRVWLRWFKHQEDLSVVDLAT